MRKSPACSQFVWVAEKNPHEQMLEVEPCSFVTPKEHDKLLRCHKPSLHKERAPYTIPSVFPEESPSECIVV